MRKRWSWDRCHSANTPLAVTPVQSREYVQWCKLMSLTTSGEKYSSYGCSRKRWCNGPAASWRTRTVPGTPSDLALYACAIVYRLALVKQSREAREIGVGSSWGKGRRVEIGRGSPGGKGRRVRTSVDAPSGGKLFQGSPDGRVSCSSSGGVADSCSCVWSDVSCSELVVEWLYWDIWNDTHTK